MSKRRKISKFNWQINASAVGKLLGYFGEQCQTEALAQTWHMNLKRMPRFNTTPSIELHQTPLHDIAKQILQKPVYQNIVTQGVDRTIPQKEAVTEMKKIAHKEVEKAIKEETITINMNIMREYSNKKRGASNATIDSYFTVGPKIYHKKTSKTTVLTTIDAAKSHNWVKKDAIVSVQQNTQIAKKVAQNIQSLADKTISTTRGQTRELTDLERVQQKYPNVKPGNNRAYFLNIAGGGFVIGKIDGSTTDTIFELKHRKSKLFHEFRRYEQVQCILYLKMSHKRKLKLVETFGDKQCFYDMRYTGEDIYIRPDGEKFVLGVQWDEIKNGLENIVRDLNRAEADPAFREPLMEALKLV